MVDSEETEALNDSFEVGLGNFLNIKNIPHLLEDNIFIFILDSNRLSSDDLINCSRLLGVSQLETMSKFRFEKDKKSYLLSKVYTQSILSAYLKKNNIKIRKNKFGKPYLDGVPSFFFNVSHSNNRLAIAVSLYSEVGVDIEFIQSDFNSIYDIAKDNFSNEECGYIFSGHCKQLSFERFTKLWTLKEAYLKALGVGLSKNMSEVVFDFIEDDSFVFYDAVMEGMKPWLFLNYRLEDCYLSVASPDASKIIKIFDIGSDLSLSPRVPAKVARIKRDVRNINEF